MNLKVKIILLIIFIPIAFIIAANFLAYKISKPTFLHNITCQTQNIISTATTIPIGASPNFLNQCYTAFAVRFSNTAFCSKISLINKADQDSARNWCVKSETFFKNRKIKY